MTFKTLKTIVVSAIATLTPTLGSDFMDHDSKKICSTCQQPLSCLYWEEYKQPLIMTIRETLGKEVSKTTKVEDILPPVTFKSIIDGKQAEETLGMSVYEILYHKHSQKADISPRSDFNSTSSYDVEIKVAFLKVLPHGGEIIIMSLGNCFTVSS